jgi:hypothetical protein
VKKEKGARLAIPSFDSVADPPDRPWHHGGNQDLVGLRRIQRVGVENHDRCFCVIAPEVYFIRLLAVCGAEK